MQKSRKVGYILAFFLGALGLHAFYYRKYIRGIIYILITLVTNPIPMMIMGWIDMFFIKKWNAEITEEKKDLSVSSKDLDGNILSMGEEQLKETVNDSSSTKNDNDANYKSDNSIFYNEEINTMEKYAHIKTPEFILDGLQQNLISNHTSKRGVSISVETHESSFIQDSFEYRDVYINEEVREIPLQKYWTTFRQLNERQFNWYFYWRTQVLQQRYLETDLSYIILFVYELINYSFNHHAAFNVSMMETLYEQYKMIQPKLGNYLPKWTADMLYELGEPELAKDWDTSSEEETPHLYQALEEKYPLQDISMNTWNKYIKYGRKSAYFNENRAKVYKVYKESIGLLERYYEEKNESLITNWFEVKEIREVRDIFKSAVMGRSYDSLHVPVKYYLASENLKEQTTALMKYSENIAREKNEISYRVKVKENTLPDELYEEIRQHFFSVSTQFKKNNKENVDSQERFKVVQDIKIEEPETAIPESPDTITEPEKDETVSTETFFDMTHIDALSEQTENLAAMFDHEEESEDNEFLHDKQETPPSVESEPDFHASFMVDEVEEEDYIDLIAALEEQEKRFISLFSERTNRMVGSEDATAFAKQSGVMLGVLLSELNYKSNEYLGDVLIESSNDHYQLSEEFAIIIDKLEEGAFYENQKT